YIPSILDSAAVRGEICGHKNRILSILEITRNARFLFVTRLRKNILVAAGRFNENFLIALVTGKLR
ncbi:MAG: hypothetical protein PVJ18_12140, partial [Desulfobacterales bacterium]